MSFDLNLSSSCEGLCLVLFLKKKKEHFSVKSFKKRLKILLKEHFYFSVRTWSGGLRCKNWLYSSAAAWCVIVTRGDPAGWLDGVRPSLIKGPLSTSSDRVGALTFLSSFPFLPQRYCTFFVLIFSSWFGLCSFVQRLKLWVCVFFLKTPFVDGRAWCE